MAERQPVGRGAFTVREAAEWLGVSEATIYRLMRRGDLPYVRLPVGGRRISRRVLEELVHPVAGPDPGGIL